ncbi:MAG: hypothetical protein ACD_58C00327G0001 [uncultured bacterium]|nr:MAG: hypothetical protein ACD_58C00327G0001 [uncultured bacterium]
MFTKILLFLLFEALGVAMITYREKIVRMIGKNDYAEKYLGAGGTYNMWSIIGMITMFVGLMILMGKFSF